MTNPLVPLIRQDAITDGIDPRWALAIGTVESGLRPDAANPSGAYGPMQLMPQTARALGVNARIPAQNVAGGTQLLAQDLHRYGNPVDATAAYFGGTDQQNWGPKTRAYIQKVVKAYQSMAKPVQPQGSSGPVDMNFIMSTMQAPKKTDSAAASVSAHTGPIDEKFILSTMESAPGPQPVPHKPSTIEQIEAGAERGLHVLTDKPAQALASAAGGAAHALGLAQTWHPGASVRRNDQKAGAAYKEQYGNAPLLSPANIADIGTQLGGAAAALMGGEGLANAGANALASATDGSALAPVANGVQNVVRLLTGRAGEFTGAGAKGALLKTASLGAQGATQAAAFNELTGRPISVGTEVAGAIANPLIGGGGILLGRAGGAVVDSSLPMAVKAARRVGAAMMADGGAPMEVIGKGGDTLATVGGPNVRGMAENLGNKPGGARSIITDYFDNLIGQHPEMMAQAVKGATGSTGDIHDLTANVIAQRSQAAGPKFQAAFERIKPTPQEIETVQPIIESPEGQQAITKALTTLRRDALAKGLSFDPSSLGFTQAPAGAAARWAIAPDTASLPALHAVKEGLDDLVEGARDPVTGKLPNTKEMRALAGMRDKFRTDLTDMFPRYKDALAAWSGPSKVIDAARQGRKVFSTDSELTTKRIKDMDPSEKAGFQAGVARAIMDKINQVQDGGKVARIFSRPDVRAKVAAAFDNPKEARQFMDLAERMNNQTAARNEILKGSQTARRMAEQQHDWSNTARDAIANTAIGRPHYAALDLLRGMMNHAKAQGNPQLDAAIANLLTNPNSAAVGNAVLHAQPGVLRNLLTGAGGVANRGITLAPLLGYEANHGVEMGP